MKIHIALLLLIALVAATHLEEEPEHEAVFMNDRCCMQYGGVPCGVVSRTCCIGRCNNWGVAQTCQGNNLPIRASMCMNSCLNQCRSQGGVICGTSFFSNSCCAPQYCQGLTQLSRTCMSGTQIPLRGCYAKSLFQ